MGTAVDTGVGAEHVPTPIDTYLAAQSSLTAVERFAARTAPATTEPASARWWRDRLPATPPAAGQQYGFRVDLDACTGCKACVAACHNLNGLRAGESWRRVGALRGSGGASGADASATVLRTVTTACHHCVEPACLEGCPANAYEKDPVTGIVRHLDDSCIGCSYCTLTCPYEVPTFDHDLGIVRKCDMCTDRLADGEAPACVQACPTGAITIDVVDVEALTAEIAATAGATLVPGAPDSSLTTPTTRYVTASPDPVDLVADDHASVAPSHGHSPLAVMLVLTQVSVGAFVLDAVARATTGQQAGRGASAVVALLTGLLALGASVLHLGRPLLAWRAVLGLGHSWLSREIVAFSAFAGAATLFAAAVVTEVGPRSLLAVAVATTGLVGVGCSAAIYAITGRWWWRWPVTIGRFAGTMGAGGATLVGATVLLAQRGDPAHPVVGDVVLLSAVASIATVVGVLAPLGSLTGASEGSTPWRTRHLLAGELRPALVARVGLGVLGGVVLPWLAVAVTDASRTLPVGPGVLLVVASVLVVAAELLERRLFFLASVAPRMPGMAR